MKWSYTKLELYETWMAKKLELEEQIVKFDGSKARDLEIAVTELAREEAVAKWDYEVWYTSIQVGVIGDMLADIFELKVDPSTIYGSDVFEGSRDLLTKEGLYYKWNDEYARLNALTDELTEQMREDRANTDFATVSEMERRREAMYVEMNMMYSVLANIGLLYDGY